MYKRILVAVDGSEHALRATDEAIKIANLTQESFIDVILVAEFSKAKSNILHSQGKEELEISRKKKLFPVEEKLQNNDLNYEVNILHGEPGPTIIKHANEGNYDLTIIGSRGLNVLQEMVLGSVSHKVIKRVDSPVMIVK